MVPVTDRGEGADRSVAEALQHGAAAFESRLSHAGRFRGEAREARRNGRPSDGADRCGIWGLRAPPRRTTVPQGANERSNRGGRLKLNVVRRTRAGQTCCWHGCQASVDALLNGRKLAISKWPES